MTPGPEVGHARRRMGGATLALVITAPLAALAVAADPRMAVAPLAIMLVLLALDHPRLALGVFAMLHLCTPAYLRLPLPGGLYQPPISNAVLLALIGFGLARFLAGATAPTLGREGRRIVTALAGFAVVALMSLIDPRTGAEGVQMWAKIFLFPGVTLLAVIAWVRDEKELATLWNFILAGALIASLYGVAEHLLRRNPLIDAFQAEVDIEYFHGEVLGDLAYRAFSVFGNPLEFSTCIGMVAPYAMVRFAAAGSVRERVIFGASAVICFLGVAVTYSRAPMMALICAVVAIGLIYRSFRPWLLGAAVTGALALAAAWSMIGEGLRHRVTDVDNLTLRLKLWEIAVAIFGDHPVLGVGIGNFPAYYLEAARDHRIGPFLEFGEGSIERIRVAENTYLQLAAETGVVGLAAAVVLVSVIVAAAARVALFSPDERLRDLSITCLCAMLIYAVNGMFITAYTHYFSTLLLIGFIFSFIIKLIEINYSSMLTDVHKKCNNLNFQI